MADDPSPDPLPLDEIEKRGATRFGQSVERVVMHLADGRRVAVDLPRAHGAAELCLTPRELRVVELFTDLGPEDRLKGVLIARAVNVQYTSIRKVLARLAKLGVLVSHGGEGGYSRGPKYPESEEE